MKELKIKRNLSGIFFPFVNPYSNTTEARVFEDLPGEEQDRFMQNRDIEWYKSMIKSLACTLREIGDKFDIVNDFKENEDDTN